MQTLVKGFAFFGSSNHYDRSIFGTRLTGEFVSSKIIVLGYATQRPTFVFQAPVSRARRSPVPGVVASME